MKLGIYDVELSLVKEKEVVYTALRNPLDAKELLQPMGLEKKAQEHIVMVAINASYKPVGLFTVAIGNVNKAIVDPKDIFKRLLLANASAFILAHNHPSGATYPSDEDIELTMRLKKGASILGLTLLDHLIITPNGDYESFIDRC